MLSRLLPIFSLVFSVFPLEAHAGQVCNTISECQHLIQQAPIRLQELLNPSGVRVSSTGAVFTRDTSAPALGEAYRDPSGLIWGSIVMAQGQVNSMTQYGADKYCRDGGARLPRKEEFEQLAKYLGRGTAQGYSPYLADGRTDFLPGLPWWTSWSSDVTIDNSGAYVFYGGVGDFSPNRRGMNFAFRCVVFRPRPR
jgi:hypothetical protein